METAINAVKKDHLVEYARLRRSQIPDLLMGLILLLLGALGIYASRNDDFFSEVLQISSADVIAKLKKLEGNLRVKASDSIAWKYVADREVSLGDGDLVFTESDSKAVVRMKNNLEFEVWPNSIILISKQMENEFAIPQILRGRVRVRINSSKPETILKTQLGKVVLRPDSAKTKTLELDLAADKSLVISSATKDVKIETIPKDAPIQITTQSKLENLVKSSMESIPRTSPKPIFPANGAILDSDTAQSAKLLEFRWSTSEEQNREKAWVRIQANKKTRDKFGKEIEEKMFEYTLNRSRDGSMLPSLFEETLQSGEYTWRVAVEYEQKRSNEESPLYWSNWSSFKVINSNEHLQKQKALEEEMVKKEVQPETVKEKTVKEMQPEKVSLKKANEVPKTQPRVVDKPRIDVKSEPSSSVRQPASSSKPAIVEEPDVILYPY